MIPILGVPKEGMLTPALLGAAARDAAEGASQSWGPPEKALQELKLLWHVLLRHGAAAV